MQLIQFSREAFHVSFLSSNWQLIVTMEYQIAHPTFPPAHDLLPAASVVAEGNFSIGVCQSVHRGGGGRVGHLWCQVPFWFLIPYPFLGGGYLGGRVLGVGYPGVGYPRKVYLLPPPKKTPQKRAVHILLECFLEKVLFFNGTLVCLVFASSSTRLY